MAISLVSSAKIQQSGVILPESLAVAGSYAPFVREGNTVYISGQLPIQGGQCQTGKVTTENLADAQKAASICADNIIGVLYHACEKDWGRLHRVAKIGVFVNAASGFIEPHKVANGASDRLMEVLGDAGLHARAAVCVSELPLGAIVEVEAIATLR